MADSDTFDSMYFYDPLLPASILFTALYTFPAAFLLYTTVIGPRTSKYRHAKIFMPAVVGTWTEVAGYII